MRGPNTRIVVSGLCIEALGILSICLIAIWISVYLRGASFTGDKQQLANLHAILMPTSLIFLEGNGIITYRLMKGLRDRDVKFFHYGFQTIALILMILGYVATYLAREEHTTPLYSMHSWLGMIVIIIFLMQVLGGIFFFYSKKIPRKAREISYAFHSFFGLFNCILAIWVACLGLTTLSTRTILLYNQFTIPGLLVNISGLAMVFFGALVFFVCTHPDFEWDKIESAKEPKLEKYVASSLFENEQQQIQ